MKALCIILLFTLISCSSTPTEVEEEPIIPVVVPLFELNPAWSPDGEKIAYVGISYPYFTYRQDKPTGIYIYDTRTGTDTPIFTNLDVDYPQWSPDGNRLVFACGNNGTCMYDLRTDSMSVILSRDHPQYNGNAAYARFVDDETVLLSVRLTTDEQIDLYTLNINSGEMERIFDSVPGVTDGVKVGGGYAYISMGEIMYYDIELGEIFQLTKSPEFEDNLEVIDNGETLIYDRRGTAYTRTLFDYYERPVIADAVYAPDMNNMGEIVYTRYVRNDGRLYIYDSNTNQRQLLIQD